MESGKVIKETFDANPMTMYKNLKTLDIKYNGIRDIEGHSCHVLKIEDIDLQKLGYTPEQASFMSQDKFDNKDVTVDAHYFIDKNQLVMRKIMLDLKDVSIDNKDKRDISIEVVNKDFRKVSGMLIAYETVSNMQMEMTAAEKQQAEQMKESMAQMKEQMKDMPESQRKMIQNQMEKAGSFMMDGNMTTTRKIQSVEVNTGLDESLFDPGTL